MVHPLYKVTINLKDVSVYGNIVNFSCVNNSIPVSLSSSFPTHATTYRSTTWLDFYSFLQLEFSLRYGNVYFPFFPYKFLNVFLKFSASGGDAMMPILQRSLKSVTYSSLCVPDSIAERGMGKIPNYYYRDDALRLWDITLKYERTLWIFRPLPKYIHITNSRLFSVFVTGLWMELSSTTTRVILRSKKTLSSRTGLGTFLNMDSFPMKPQVRFGFSTSSLTKPTLTKEYIWSCPKTISEISLYSPISRNSKAIYKSSWPGQICHHGDIHWLLPTCGSKLWTGESL